MRKRQWLRILPGLAIGVFFAWWLFRGTDWGAVWASLRRVRLGWLVLAEATILGGFLMRIFRWRYIVRAGGDASFRSLFSATQIGFLANFTLPLRLGEAVRALVLTRLTRIPFSQSFAMVALDRVTDLIGLICVMLVAIAAFRPEADIVLPPEIYPHPVSADLIRTGAMGTAVFLAAVVGVLVLLYINRRLALRISDACVGMVSKPLAVRVHKLVDEFADGLHVFRSGSDMAKSIGFSLLTWGSFILTYWTVMFAFGCAWPWYAPFVTTAVLAVALSIPGAPGFVGQFHFAIAVSATVIMPDLPLADAKAIAILAHLVNLLPIAAVGVLCLVWEDLGFLELARTSAEAQPEVETPTRDSE